MPSPQVNVNHQEVFGSTTQGRQGGFQSPGASSSSEGLSTSPYTDYFSSLYPEVAVAGPMESAGSARPGRKSISQLERLQQQLCEICSCQASEYKYYGAHSCQSCRAFFRRAVQKAG